MKYYSTNKITNNATLSEAVIKGLAPDKGLFMPENIKILPAYFFQNIDTFSLQEMSFGVAHLLFSEDVNPHELIDIVYSTMNFDIPLVKVENNIFSLELFHGPTLAFKDVGARFMSRILAYFLRQQNDRSKEVNVLVATSGDTGSAVANGFLGVKGIRVYVLYPKGLVSPVQECQFTTLGKNITAIEVDGTFDDCQALVKEAFSDRELNEKLKLTSANSINVARFLPQAFYYFCAYAQLKKIDSAAADNMVISVPSGNFGNLTAGLLAKRMGLPVKRFLAANNSNDVFLEYLKTAEYNPRASQPTIANAMDVGAPSNFARILDLYNHSHSLITADISGASYSDGQIANSIRDCKTRNGYLLVPHGACAYQALKDNLENGETGIFIETAHPAKFQATVEQITGEKLEIPERLQAFMKGKKQSEAMSKHFADFKAFLMG
jgi:threonine synthase